LSEYLDIYPPKCTPETPACDALRLIDFGNYVTRMGIECVPFGKASGRLRKHG